MCDSAIGWVCDREEMGYIKIVLLSASSVNTTAARVCISASPLTNDGTQWNEAI